MNKRIPHNDSRAIGKRLRALRQEHAWLLEDAAHRIGVNAQHLSRLELGQYQNPKMDLLISIADAYAVTLDFLCGRKSHADAGGLARHVREG